MAQKGLNDLKGSEPDRSSVQADQDDAQADNEQDDPDLDRFLLLFDTCCCIYKLLLSLRAR